MHVTRSSRWLSGNRRVHPFAWLVVASLLVAQSGASARSDEPVTFETHAAPFFAAYCVSCHQGAAAEGGLDLSHFESWERGGDSGSPLARVAQPADDSPRSVAIATLIGSRVATHEMPPADFAHQPPPESIERLIAWLEAGAPWPADAKVDEFAVSTQLRAGRDWWSLQPLPSALLATPADLARRVESPIDAWLEQAREQRGLAINSRADRRTLLIRASVDLHGLPPELSEIERFANDQRPDAWARELDRLLASPRVGQRWARHWLDVARYGDTHGYERDFPRAHAWRYRDWVIDSFNLDLPYEEFVRWQVAGDVLAPENPAALVATSFLAAGPYDVTGLAETPNPVLQRMARADELDDMVSTTVNAFLGLTIHCARCHSHKVDPISQTDYYRFAALLSGVHRGDMSVLPASERAGRDARRAQLQEQLASLRLRRQELEQRIDLASIVGGGTGLERREVEQGVDPRTGLFTRDQVDMLEEVEVNRWVRSVSRFIDGVTVPDGGTAQDGQVVISSTGLTALMPDTTGQSWDYFQNGPVHSQAHTTAGTVDYASEEHSMLGMHANKLITFDLSEIRGEATGDWVFEATVAYGGRELQTKAVARILVDGEEKFAATLTRESGPVEALIPLSSDSRFLTLVATDGEDGIGHDQVFWGDPWLHPSSTLDQQQRRQELEQLALQISEIDRELDQLAETPWTYGLVVKTPIEMHVALRGDPEQQGEVASPGMLSCLSSVESELASDASDAERRVALADWLTGDAKDLLARVIVNRLWLHHFGRGLVATPSDFGFNGEPATHPELLDALAQEFIRTEGSLKLMHRKMMLSEAWQLSAESVGFQRERDQDNRWLWRFAPRRLEAEAIRDRVLQVAGTLDERMGGPGFRDFEFSDRYAPIYRHTVTDSREFWRRSIYRFAVRSVPDPLMESLDCPNPSTAAPQRNDTTTAVQALALLNGELTLQQAQRFAQRLEQESAGNVASQVHKAFEAALLRAPDEYEQAWGETLVKEAGLRSLCRALLNCNEFLYWE